MLDDLKLIHNRDSQDALGRAEKQWQQLDAEFELPAGSLPEHIDKVVWAGMGGSALSALVAQKWPGVGRPFEIVRDYDLPQYVSSGTLCFIVSYSGNTEEALEALDHAESAGAQIIVIAHGGKLQQLAAEKGLPFLLIPDAGQPRYAVWFILKAALTVFDACGLTEGAVAALVAEKQWLEQQTAAWRPDVPTAQNYAKQIALELMGKSVVIYAGPKLFPAAYKWKISCNENAKHIAWCNQFSEFNHNEFIGWSKQPVDKPYAVVELRSALEHARIQKRFDVSGRLLSGIWPNPIRVDVQGDTLLRQLMYAIALGDFATLYLALLNGIDPTPVDLIEKLKVELG
jgi:glucose/mannose-6-phosphate isomerase